LLLQVRELGARSQSESATLLPREARLLFWRSLAPAGERKPLLGATGAEPGHPPSAARDRVPARQSRPAQSGALVRLRRRWCGLGAKNFAVARSTPPSRKAGKIHAPRQPARGRTVAPFPLTASSFRVRAQAILQHSSHQLGRRHLLPFPPQRQRRAARASSPRHGRQALCGCAHSRSSSGRSRSTPPSASSNDA